MIRRWGTTIAKLLFAATLLASDVTSMAGVAAAQVASSASASIVVEGNRRVEADTIRSYFKPGPDGRLDPSALDDGLKGLIATGLFQDVKINGAGGRLVVAVVENPVIGRVVFEGNKKIKDEQLSAELQSRPRGALSRAVVQSDTLRIAEIYRRSGRYDVRVTPEVIDRPNGRVDLVFRVEEGAKTGVKSIEFVGNVAFSASRLRDVIRTRETNFLSFLASNDIYDPDRVEADRDLIRRFYLKNGFADAQVVAALTEFDPDKKGFLITFKIEEGQQYRIGSVDFRANIPGFDPNWLRSYSRVKAGALYNVELLEKSVEEMQIEASRRGFSFAVVKPSGDRNFDSHTVSVTFNADEGARIYIERIEIRGNTRTRDYVLRREFDVAEGDAYNRALVDRAERRLKNLDFFKSVKIVTEPGSSTDRVILAVEVEEKSTGDFSVSGGYSTSDGALGEVSVSERNLMGRGLFGKVSVSYGQYSRGASLSIVEPYLFDYRLALGLDLYYKQQLQNSYTSYDMTTLGFSPRLGIALREDLSLQLRYSLYQQKVTLSDAYNNCNNNAANTSLSYNPTPAYIKEVLGGVDPTNASGSSYYGYGCYADGETSLPVRKELADGAKITSSIGYTLNYNTLDNTKNPTDGLLLDLRQDFAGVGGDVTYLKTVGDAKYYTPLVAEIVGLIHLQGGVLSKLGNNEIRMLDHFQMGANLVRGFATNGIGPRDISYWSMSESGDSLGGTKYWGASFELQMPFWFLPKEVGLKGAVYADAGSLWGYQGPTSWAATGEVNSSACPHCGLQYDDSKIVRSSVGVGLIWASPFGPLRFDYAIPLSKGKYDTVQEFKFGGGTSF
ncbi:surface antigen [Rhodopseudomonas palustris HaA2]|uniref:Outer membrane protein assembly factor BamA n=1 Tax=Rhodopseudomonas palustris (strain HaA2) TaxID=316058 RepID=Q2J248_RHOP2|nr:outer membrane protein assembly factor BamA [Rhodopseudomonas palustris]ABD05462.1 surface antigen [Rhodopseudomonas palustris HaA2]